MDIAGEDREQRADVGQYDALPAVDPEQIGIPVVVRDHRQSLWPRAEQAQQLRSAAEDHDAAQLGSCAAGALAAPSAAARRSAAAAWRPGRT